MSSTFKEEDVCYIECFGTLWKINDDYNGLVVYKITENGYVDYAGNVYIITETSGRCLSPKDSDAYLYTIEKDIISIIEHDARFTRKVLEGPTISLGVGLKTQEITQRKAAKMIRKLISSGIKDISIMGIF